LAHLGGGPCRAWAPPTSGNGVRSITVSSRLRPVGSRLNSKPQVKGCFTQADSSSTGFGVSEEKSLFFLRQRGWTNFSNGDFPKLLFTLILGLLMARTVIAAGQVERQYWRDLWHYRELFYVLAWRDISVRYKQTAIGVVWAIIQPLITTVIFTIFGKLAKIPPGGVPYPLLVMAATLPWQFFSTSLTGSSQSLVANSNLISKIYFPRMIVPAGAVITALVDFLITFVLFLGLMAWFHFLPTWRFVVLPFLVVVAFLAALGPGLLLTALNVKYRDFRYIIPFIVQIGIYVSPVAFPSTLISPTWRWFYSLNPMVGVIDGFRWALLDGKGGLTLPSFTISLVVNALFVVLGVWYFRRTERSFADVI
jgi:lipopolysaccharide transport system permease protein